jgi:hypothetical protein
MPFAASWQPPDEINAIRGENIRCENIRFWRYDMKKRSTIIVGAVVVVVLLATAAFVGGKLLSGGKLQFGPGGGILSIGGNNNGHVTTNFSPKIKPAVELPQTPPAANGIFDHRQDNSIFVGTGSVQVQVQAGPNGSVGSSSHSGPTIEVVVTTRTRVFRDTTMDQYNGKTLPNGSPTLQQTVETGTLDELGQGSLVTAWGQKTGDRIIADVLVYTLPDFISK